MTDCALFASLSVAQRSISLPKPEKPEQREQLPRQIPPRTFGIVNPPPRGYSPPPFEEKTSKQFNLYRLDFGDGIGITVQRFPEFNFSGVIDPEGNVVMPILGRISLVGLSLDEVEAKIRYELSRRYLQNEPEVIAVLVGPRPVQITVLGEVVRPGFYTLAPGSELTAVLSSAGGSTTTADLRSIIVRRSLVDGTVIEETVDLYTPLITGRIPPRLRLQGGDTVIVSKLDVGEDQDYDRLLVSRTTLPQQTITVRILVPAVPSGIALRNLTVPNGSTFIDVIASLPIVDRIRIQTNKIALMRFDAERGGVVTQTLNPGKAIEGDISQNVPLQDEDVIIISRTLIGNIFSAFNIITQPIRDLLGFRNFFNSILGGGSTGGSTGGFF
ncbi:MAG: polysaccharide biosynthesis/export family protein [Xenococcaceae cyanobacterium]